MCMCMCMHMLYDESSSCSTHESVRYIAVENSSGAKSGQSHGQQYTGTCGELFAVARALPPTSAAPSGLGPVALVPGSPGERGSRKVQRGHELLLYRVLGGAHAASRWRARGAPGIGPGLPVVVKYDIEGR